MKIVSTFLVLSLLSFYHFLGAQVYPEGISTMYLKDKLPMVQLKPKSFVFLDSYGNLWTGLGAYYINSQSLAEGKRANYGLLRYSENAWSQQYTSGTFTDAMQVNDTVYFTSYEGLFKFDGQSFSQEKNILNANCITSFKNKLFIGTVNSGLYERGASSLTRHGLVVNGTSYDSVYSLAATDEYLYIGTRNGLLRYDGSNFVHYGMPHVNTGITLSNSLQDIVLSMQVDAAGELWVLSAGDANDTIDNLFRLRSGRLDPVSTYYTHDCRKNLLVKHRINKLSLHPLSRNVIFNYGDLAVIEMTPEHIRPYYTAYFYVQPGGSPPSPNPNNMGRWQGVFTTRDGNIYLPSYDGETYKVLDVSHYNEDSFAVNYHDLIDEAAFGTLDINDVKAKNSNIGSLFERGSGLTAYGSEYSLNIPSRSCASAMYTAGLWLGAREQSTNGLHLAASTYRMSGSEYLPGPLDTLNGSYDEELAQPYNRVWKISRMEIEAFRQNYNKPGYEIPASIAGWPAHGTGNFTRDMAPFVDVDGNKLYEPAKGDYPKIKGDQMLWWVFNDVSIHSETQGIPLRAEIHGSAYAYYYKDMPLSDTDAIVNSTVFYSYKVINRSYNTYKDFCAGIFTDPDFGNYADDMVSSDTAANAVLVYNGDGDDEGTYNFGKNPPVLFCKFMNHKLGAFVVPAANANPQMGFPTIPQQYYNLLQGYYTNGDTLKNENNHPTAYQYTFNPCKASENPGKIPGDMRFIMSAEPLVLKSGESYTLEFAYALYYPDKNYDDTTRCDRYAPQLKKLQRWYDQKSFPSKPEYGLDVKDLTDPAAGINVYPNPASSKIHVTSALLSNEVNEIVITDITGKVLFSDSPLQTDETLNFEADLEAFPSGIYIIKVGTKKGKKVTKFVKE